jgi:ATP-dependent DNA helicase RecQ
MCDPKSPRKIQHPVFKSLAVKSTKKKVFAFTDSSTLSPIEERRFKLLKEWRRKKAEELDLPAFVIFGDKTLRELAQKNPKKLSDLTGVYGIGEQKMEKFGWDILAELKD